MRTRLLSLAILAAAITAWPVAARDKPANKPAKPTLVIRIGSIDSLLADAHYLAKLAGKGEQAEQAEKMLKSMGGDGKGLAGVDTTKPMGLYGYLGPGGIDSQAVVLLPIADEKAFLDKLESFGLKAEKGEGDLWKLDFDKIPFPIYFRFANEYVYVTVRDQEVLEKGKLLDPATVLAGSGTVSAVVNLDGIPKELKEMALAQTELQLANAKEKDMPKDKDAPGETKAQKAFRQAVLDEAFHRVKELLNDGGPLAARLEIDRKGGELTLTASLAGKPDTKLAEGIAQLGKVTSIGAGTVRPDAAMSIQIDVALPNSLREAIGPVIEEGLQQASEKQTDEATRKVAESVIKAIAPTLKMGELDAGASLSGPDSAGLYTLIGVAKIKDGKTLEAALKDAVKESPNKAKGSLSIDFAKVGDINIHKAVPDKVDEGTRNTLGDGAVYFAFRENAVIVAAGPGALDAIKTAATASAGPGKILQIDIAASRVATAKHMAAEHKEAPAIAKRVFKGGDDTIRIVFEGGDTLKLSLRMKAQLVKFFAELGESK
jgi:hypothetical protein